jgi:DNA-binding transcriptional ArsR family regulator
VKKMAGKNIVTKYEFVSIIVSLLGHPIRLRIIKFLNDKKTATWKEIVEDLENMFGKLNPNTINFHLTMLVNKKIVKKEEEKYSLIDFEKNELIKSALKIVSEE